MTWITSLYFNSVTEGESGTALLSSSSVAGRVLSSSGSGGRIPSSHGA